MYGAGSVRTAGNAHLDLQVALQMGLRRKERLLIPFQARDHQCSLKRGNNQRRNCLRIDVGPNLFALKSGRDDLGECVPPLMPCRASSVPQERMAVVCLNRGILNRTTTWNGRPALNKVHVGCSLGIEVSEAAVHQVAAQLPFQIAEAPALQMLHDTAAQQTIRGDSLPPRTPRKRAEGR